MLCHKLKNIHNRTGDSFVRKVTDTQAKGPVRLSEPLEKNNNRQQTKQNKTGMIDNHSTGEVKIGSSVPGAP